MANFIPSLITFIVSMIGIFWDKPPRFAKALLVALALVAAYFSYSQSESDERDKKFFQLALTSTLSPSNSSYALIAKQVETVLKGRGYVHYSCIHSRDGMICLVNKGSNDDAGTVVLNRNDVANLYANTLYNTDNKDLIDTLLDQDITSLVSPSEELKDKIGILGFEICTVFRGCLPESYFYDRYGVHVIAKDQSEHTIDLLPTEIMEVKPGKPLKVFNDIERLFRTKFASINGT